MSGISLRGFADGVIGTYVEMGTAALERGEYEIAYKMYKAAFDEPSSRMQKGKFLGPLLVNMGRTHEGLRQLYKAKLFYIRALAHHKKVSQTHDVFSAEVLATLARITAEQGLYRQAADFAEQAHEAFRMAGEPPSPQLQRTVRRIQEIYTSKGRSNETIRLQPFFEMVV